MASYSGPIDLNFWWYLKVKNTRSQLNIVGLKKLTKTVGLIMSLITPWLIWLLGAWEQRPQPISRAAMYWWGLQGGALPSPPLIPEDHCNIYCKCCNGPECLCLYFNYPWSKKTPWITWVKIRCCILYRSTHKDPIVVYTNTIIYWTELS